MSWPAAEPSLAGVAPLATKAAQGATQPRRTPRFITATAPARARDCRPRLRRGLVDGIAIGRSSDRQAIALSVREPLMAEHRIESGGACVLAGWIGVRDALALLGGRLPGAQRPEDFLAAEMNGRRMRPVANPLEAFALVRSASTSAPAPVTTAADAADF